MRVCHSLDPVFDDPNLIALGGLPAVMTLAEQAGLHDLVDEHVTVPGTAGANASVKVGAIVAGMVAGADSISDLEVLRHGGMGRVFNGLRAATTAALTESLTGRFTDHHAFLVELHLDLIDERTAKIEELTARIEAAMAPFHALRDLLISLPGVNTRVADVIIAETGGDMSRFPSAAHVASWAGVCPGHHESAGRVKSTKTRPGNRYLKGSLGIAALSIARSPGTFLNAKYRRLVRRLGKLQALVAIEHAILVAVWNMISTGAYYDDPGPDNYARNNPERTERNAIRQLRSLGYEVTLKRTA